MKAYDEFDNLVFQKDGEIMDKQDREKFVKELWSKFDEANVARLELELTKLEEVDDVAREAGLNLKAAITERFSGKVENKSNIPKGK